MVGETSVGSPAVGEWSRAMRRQERSAAREVPDSIPSHIHIAGCTRSFEEIAQFLNSVKTLSEGDSDAGIREEDISVAKERLKEEYDTGNIGAPAGYIRYLNSSTL